MQVTQRAAVITGAAGGIGCGVAIALAKCGDHLALANVNANALEQTRQILSPNAAANPQAVVHYTAYAYDGAGNPTSLTYPSGRVLSIAYANGLPTGMTLAGASLITNLQYPPDSALSGSIGSPKSWSWAMASGPLAHSRSFDLNGRLTRYPLGEHLRDVTYDAANRITGYKHYIAATGSTAPVQDQQFAYDALGRLTQATTSQASWTYTYDANGNRTSVAVNAAGSTGATPNAYTVDPASNRVTGITTPAITLTHDAMGNIVSDGTYTMGYDLRGRLTTAAQGGNTTTYAYDNAGQRVRKHNNQGTANTVIFVYDPSGQLLGEYDSTGQAIREYVWLENMPVAMFMPDPAQGANANTAAPLVYFIHADHLNTPRVLVDKTNTMRWRWVGEPFGTTPADTSPAGQSPVAFNLRFPGQYHDSESGMFYNYQRDYIPGIGRYAQSDPIGLQGGINTYLYAGANPLSFTDPMGLKHKANSAHCSALRKKMQNLRNDLDDRWSDLAADRLNLPERLGPGELLSQTKRGHRTMINDRESNLRKFEKRYSDECEDDDDNGSSQSCDTGCAAVGAAATVGAGYVAYRCLRMLPSLFPPLWPTIPANVVVP